jgi:hypothetical protein
MYIMSAGWFRCSKILEETGPQSDGSWQRLTERQYTDTNKNTVVHRNMIFLVQSKTDRI